jgi:hypothetical protein
VRAEDVWIEVIAPEGLPPERSHALRLQVHQYGDEVGGFLELYALDGACNTRLSPYFCLAHCVAFGPGALRAGSWRVRADGVDGSPIALQVETRGRRALVVRVVQPGGVVFGTETDPPDAGATLELARDAGARVPRGCTASLTALPDG